MIPTPPIVSQDRDMTEENEAMEWQPIDTAPKDGTWFLLRGRNSVGAPMIPVVCAWRSEGGYAWRDSASLRDMTHLVIDVPVGDSADWHALP